jgi:hypothetical protein
MKWLKRCVLLLILVAIGATMGHAGAQWVRRKERSTIILPAGPEGLARFAAWQKERDRPAIVFPESQMIFPDHGSIQDIPQPVPGILRVRAQAKVYGTPFYPHVHEVWWAVEIVRRRQDRSYETVWTQDYGQDRRRPPKGDFLAMAFDDSFALEPGFYLVSVMVRENTRQVHGPNPEDIEDTPAILGSSFTSEVK